VIPITIQQASQAEAFALGIFKRTFIGDILLGEKYIQPRMWQNERLLDDPYIWLGMVADNPWAALKRLGVPFQEFREDVSYQCEFDQAANTYYWMVPRVIVPSNWDAWKKRMEDLSIQDHVLDYEFHRSMTWSFRDPEDREEALKKVSIHPDPISIPGVMMGHGYAPGFIPYDGSRGQQAMIVKLSDGSDMICSCWIWFNK